MSQIDPLDFAARVKKTNRQANSSLAKKRVFWTAKLLKGIAIFTLALGVIFALGFIITMESVYAQLGNLANSQFAAQLEATPELMELMGQAGIGWFPIFLKIYTIRFLLALGILGLLGSISLIIFSIAIKKRTP